MDPNVLYYSPSPYYFPYNPHLVPFPPATQYYQQPLPPPPPLPPPFQQPYPAPYHVHPGGVHYLPQPQNLPVNASNGPAPSHLPEPHFQAFPPPQHQAPTWQQPYYEPIPPPPPPPVKAVDQPKIHDYWKGRIVAPLPGSSAYRPVPVQLSSSRAIPIVNVDSRKRQLSPRAKNLPSSPGRIQPLNGHAGPNLDSEEDFPPLSAVSASSPSELRSLEPSTSKFVLDRYADVFTPKWLEDVQKQPQTLIPLPPLPPFPSPGYLLTFLLPRFIESKCKPRTTHLLSTAPPPFSHPPPLSIQTYEPHWTTLLLWELDHLIQDKERHVLWKHKVRVADWDTADFVFKVAGLRENYPRLEIGDLIHLREISERLERGTGQAFEGRITVVHKRVELVHMHCVALKQHIIESRQGQPNNTSKPRPGSSNSTLITMPEGYEIPILFNISFIMNSRFFFLMHVACATMHEILKKHTLSDPPLSNVARKWLFPEHADLESGPRLLARDSETRWIDAGLNNEQRSAVLSVAQNESTVPYLISGPPGTGKTRTVVEMVLQILRLQPEACILLCAPSHAATNTLVLRLRDHLKPTEMLRLNDQSRTFAEIPDEIKHFCYIENNSYTLPPWKFLMRYRVVVCSCLDASILVTARCTNVVLMEVERDMVSTVHPHRSKREIKPHWTHLLIDEAAQGSEPELLIPISVVITEPHEDDQLCAEDGNTVSTPQLVLCGDPNQLGPIVSSEPARSAELNVSLLERLFERPVYSSFQPQIYPNGVNGYASSSTFSPLTHLVRNYRSHPVILMPPSAIFYKDALEPFAENGDISWSRLSNKDFPLLFIGHDSNDISDDDRASWFNTGDVSRVVETIESLLAESAESSPPLQADQIGVMAPWRAQVWKIREVLREKSLSKVDVGTVEDFQGRECRVIIISCVRSRWRFVEEDKKRGFGLMWERKRMNVAITRAKELLVVIGNGAIMQRDPYWRPFLQFALRHGLYVGPKLSLQSDGNWISRLESIYIKVIGRDAELNPEEQGEFTAGSTAREVLRD